MGNNGKIAEHAPPPGDVGGEEVRRDLSPPGTGASDEIKCAITYDHCDNHPMITGDNR